MMSEVVEVEVVEVRWLSVSSTLAVVVVVCDFLSSSYR